MFANLRYGFRSLVNTPGLTAIAVLSIALGIGANTAIFTLTDAILFRALPVRHPDRLALFHIPNARPVGMVHGSPQMSFSYPMYRELRDRSHVFAGLLARGQTQLSLTRRGESERVLASLVSGNFFEVLGMDAAVGRLLTPDDDRVPGGHPVVVLSHAYWVRRFGGDPGVVGSGLQINAQPVTVIGVAAPGFQGLEPGTQQALFIPMAMAPVYLQGGDRLPDSGRHWLQLIGRLNPGVTREQAEVSIKVLYTQLLASEEERFDAEVTRNSRKFWLEQTIALKPGYQGIGTLRRQSERALQVLMTAVGFVLLIACANVANLLLGRGLRRSREFAIRSALGAPRSTLIRQVLTESLLLSLGGGLFGVLLSFCGIAGIRLLLPGSFALPNDLTPDMRVLAFTLLLSIASGILVGLIPAWRSSQSEVAAALKSQAKGIVSGGSSRGLRGALVVTQVALSLVLLVGAALFLKSLRNLHEIDLGFDRSRMVLASADPGLNGYTQERAHAFFEALRERLQNLPGVRAIALAKVPLVGRLNWSVQIQVEGLEPRETEPIYTRMNWISPGYFQTVGVPMLDGRDIDARDHADAPKVAIVNQTFARRYFADKSPLGRRFGVGERSAPLDLEIIGVVKDSKYRDPKEKPEPTAYFSYLQSPMLDSTLHVRVGGSPEALIADIRRVVQTLDARIPLYDVKTLDAQIDETMTNERLVAAVTTGFGALATVLAAVGLYGVLAFSVARRTREIGIRMALGADRISVLRMIFRETLALAGVGVILGLGGAWALTRYAGSLLYEVKPMDPVVLSAGVGGILLVAVASGYLPARRASRTDPIHALKQE